MPMIVPFLPAIIGGVSKIAGGLIQNKRSNRTQTYSRQGTSSSTSKSKLTPRQKGLEKFAIKALLDLIQGGPGNIPQNEKNAAYGDINRVYNAQIPRLRAMATARGSTGGQLGSLQVRNEVDRSNARQQATSGLLDKARNTWLQAIFGSKQFLTPRTITTTGTTSEQGEGTAPSQIGNILGQAGSDFATALWLKNLLGQGGDAEGGSYFSNPDSPYYVPPGPEGGIQDYPEPAPYPY